MRADARGEVRANARGEARSPPMQAENVEVAAASPSSYMYEAGGGGVEVHVAASSRGKGPKAKKPATLWAGGSDGKVAARSRAGREATDDGAGWDCRKCKCWFVRIDFTKCW